MKRSVKVGGALVLLLALGACTAGSVESAHAASSGDLSQFFLGFWQGLIAPVMLIVEVINRLAPHVLPWATVRFYEAKGTGVPYDVGFYLGLAGSPVALLGWSRRRRD
jgi:hypothetical protein